jgi:glutathione S-transferase
MKKKSVPQCPWLELDDGAVLTQTDAINMLCADLTGFWPTQPLQVARTIELTSALDEVRVISLALG